MALTDSKLRSIQAPYTGKSKIFDRDGLTARITKSAVISFYFRFHFLLSFSVAWKAAANEAWPLS